MGAPAAPVAPVDPLTGVEAARFGIYVHFPYCLSKCPYCDFASTAAREVPEERYARAVLRELEMRLSARPELAGRRAQSLYFGGGTPSLWSARHVAGVLESLAARVGLEAGAEVTLEAAQAAARLCALNVLAQVKAAAGDWSHVKRCVRVCGYVSSAPDFFEQPKVLDGASDLMVQALGDAGKHARSALGVLALRGNVPVVIDAIFELAG